jgi:hypothetical protein
MATALVITAEGDFYQTDIPSENGHNVIHEIVDGWFDCVRREAVIGYVHDEGLLIGLPVNVVASALFGRPLVGNCVVMGALNERGEYDGENHDAPSGLLSNEFIDEALKLLSDETVKEQLTQIVTEMDLAPKFVSLTDDEMDAWLTGEGE